MKRVFKNAAPAGLVFLNFQGMSNAKVPAASEVPTLLPEAKMGALTNGDPEPFYKVEAIDFPAKGSGGVYDGSFFKSFVNVTKDRPIPGSKRGHEWSSRGASDFYTVGGRIDSTDNGKTGTALLKIYIPPTGDPTENAAFIRDAKAGMVHFSLVTMPDYNVKTETDDMGNKVQVRHFTATMGRERNDAMEYGAGAMAQLVNSQGTVLDIDAAKALIASGKIDKVSNVEGDPVQDGIVYRSALRRLASRANEEERPVLAELISLIDKSQKNGGKSVDKEEAKTLLANLIANGAEKISDIAKALGFGDKLRNEADEANAETVKAFNAKLGEKPLEALDSILAENKANAEATVKNAVIAAVGTEKIKNAGGVEIDNPAHAYALSKCQGLAGEPLKNAIEGLKKDPVMVALNAQMADGNSQINRVVSGGAKPTVANESTDGVITHRVGKE